MRCKWSAAGAAILLLILMGSSPLVSGQATPPPVPNGQPPASPPSETPITPQQEAQLFRSVTEILHFASDDTRLPIEHPVKRKLINRPAVEKYILDKFRHDKDARRMEHQEVVLKKFGFLDRDFDLRRFLVSLLTEQIAGFYDNKTKTVYLLNWVAPEEQKPVLAHELTHALQDQHVDLQKWEPDLPDKPSRDVKEDNHRISIDEQDASRDAVLEGQAMTVYLDYQLAPSGRSVRTSPEFHPGAQQDFSSYPVMARAPKLLQESLLFPYTYGLAFEQRLLKDKGPQYAFAGVLDDPPSSSYQIMNPRAYEEKLAVPRLRMPDLHPLLLPEFQPYDIGVMGELDVRILAGIYSGPEAAEDLAPAWNGGIYYVAQKRSATTPQEKASTASLAVLYLSSWRTEHAAKELLRIFSAQIDDQYSQVTREEKDETNPNERIYQTEEGPVLIVRQGKQVFVSESFPLEMARKLQFLLFGAQQSEQEQMAARLLFPFHRPQPGSGLFLPSLSAEPAAQLSGWLSGFGILRAAMPCGREPVQ